LCEIRVAAWEDRAAVAALGWAWTEENAGVPVEDDSYEQRYADERGSARVVLSPSPRSVPFYARGGFEPATSLMVREADPGS
jgi:hypothetical protein